MIEFYNEELAYLSEGRFTKDRIDFDPSKFSNPADAAKGLYRALVKAAEARGQKASEVFISPPAETNEALGYECWRVCWEAGPFDWAVEASFQIRNGKWYTEPYYGFDLLFVR